MLLIYIKNIKSQYLILTLYIPICCMEHIGFEKLGVAELPNVKSILSQLYKKSMIFIIYAKEKIHKEKIEGCH
jgi:hypothetical protein